MRRSFGSISKRGDAWQVRWSEVVCGKRVQKARTVHGTRRDAEMFLASVQLRCGRSERASTSITLREYWDAYYSAQISTLAPSTRAGYERTWENVVEPLLGGIDMSGASRAQLRHALLSITPAGRQRNAYKLLRQMFNAAHADELIDENPMNCRMRLQKVPRRGVSAYTAQEVESVLGAVYGDFCEPFVICSMLGGMRREESCALRWDDFSWVGGRVVVSVSRTAQLVRGEVVVGATKTAKSTRMVVMSGYAADRLRELASVGWLNDRDGSCGDPERVAQRWKRLCERLGIRHVPFTGLRATFSTLHAAIETPDALVSSSMGHTQISTRYRHYLAESIDAKSVAADALAGVVRRCAQKPTQGKAKAAQQGTVPAARRRFSSGRPYGARTRDLGIKSLPMSRF